MFIRQVRRYIYEGAPHAKDLHQTSLYLSHLILLTRSNIETINTKRSVATLLKTKIQPRYQNTSLLSDNIKRTAQAAFKLNSMGLSVYSSFPYLTAGIDFAFKNKFINGRNVVLSIMAMFNIKKFLSYSYPNFDQNLVNCLAATLVLGCIKQISSEKIGIALGLICSYYKPSDQSIQAVQNSCDQMLRCLDLAQDGLKFQDFFANSQKKIEKWQMPQFDQFEKSEQKAKLSREILSANNKQLSIILRLK